MFSLEFKPRLRPKSVLERLRSIQSTSIDTDRLCIFTLLCRQHLPLYLFSIKTFLAFSGLQAHVVVCNDGSLNDLELGILRECVPGTAVTCSNEILAHSTINRLQRLARFCRENIFGKRICALHTIVTARKFILLDADVLFLRCPAEIAEWAAGEDLTEALYIRDPSYAESVNVEASVFAEL